MGIFDEFQREFENLVREFSRSGSTMATFMSAWQPAMDVLETQDEVILRLEIAGVPPENVRIVASGDELRIAGVRMVSDVGKPYRYHRAEIRTGPFLKVLRLDWDVSVDEISARYANGLLEIVMPKSVRVRRERVVVRIA